MRASLVSLSREQIVVAPMEQYRLFQQRKKQRQARSAPAGRGHSGNRPGGQVHRLWPPSLRGESNAYATTAASLGTYAPSAPTCIVRLQSTLLSALAGGGAAGVEGQDKGAGGR